MSAPKGHEATPNELMVVAAARALEGRRVCFVGVGLPNIAVNLAKRTVAPQMELVYEAGVFGASPARLPLSGVDCSVRPSRTDPEGCASRSSTSRTIIRKSCAASPKAPDSIQRRAC